MNQGVTSAADWLVIAPVLIPMICGALLLMFRHQMRWHGLLAVAGLVLLLVADVALLGRVLQDGPQVMVMGSWLPPFGIAFTADLLGAGFALAAPFVGLACYALFAARHRPDRRGATASIPFLMLMMAGVSGAFLTGDIFNLYVWFEVFVIASFGLLILGSERVQLDGAIEIRDPQSRRHDAVPDHDGAALRHLRHAQHGRSRRGASVMRARTCRCLAIAALFLLAFAMKAAAFPLNFWLPASYHTPRIVIGALFGGLLTKIGIYALLRVLVMLMPDERAAAVGHRSPGVAIATMLLGAHGRAGADRTSGGSSASSSSTASAIMLAGLAIGGQAGLAARDLLRHSVHARHDGALPARAA